MMHTRAWVAGLPECKCWRHVEHVWAAVSDEQRLSVAAVGCVRTTDSSTHLSEDNRGASS